MNLINKQARRPVAETAEKFAAEYNFRPDLVLIAARARLACGDFDIARRYADEVLDQADRAGESVPPSLPAQARDVIRAISRKEAEQETAARSGAQRIVLDDDPENFVIDSDGVAVLCRPLVTTRDFVHDLRAAQRVVALWLDEGLPSESALAALRLASDIQKGVIGHADAEHCLPLRAVDLHFESRHLLAGSHTVPTADSHGGLVMVVAVARASLPSASVIVAM